jgi:hypothetical protein
VRRWLDRLRTAAPQWGVLYDPGQMVWMAVCGRDTLVVADTPAELSGRIAAHVPARTQPERGEERRPRWRSLPPGVARL